MTLQNWMSQLESLSVADRVILAGMLLDSVQPDPVEAIDESSPHSDAELDTEWRSELERRWSEIESGKVRCRDLDDFLASFRNRT